MLALVCQVGTSPGVTLGLECLTLDQNSSVISSSVRSQLIMVTFHLTWQVVVSLIYYSYPSSLIYPY